MPYSESAQHADWSFSMNTRLLQVGLLSISVVSMAILTACNQAKGDVTAGAPPPAKVVRDVDVTLFQADHPEQFPFVATTAHKATAELVVTGTVSPDVSRNVPVVSLVSGRIVAVHARLGDTVKAGQVLLSVRSSDVASGFADYRKAVRDEALARTQLERARDLQRHGAMSLSDLQNAENAANKAQIDVETTEEHLRLLGNDPSRPNGIVDIVAPVSGVITDQQIANAAGVQSLGAAPFTISDLSSVWIVCDVYENDLASVQIGDVAEIRLNAYPDRILRGRISNIGATLDPNIRTAKVRIEVPNPGIMRLGMFVKATFRGQRNEMRTAVPSTAIVHIHDRDYVYVPAPGNKFRRVEVVGGDNLPGNMQEVKSGIAPGQQVVANALVLEHTIAQ
jgi:membrane fusion protein, heavy metal efflux system